MEPDDLKYPVGRFRRAERLTAEERRAAIEELEGAPARVREAIGGLDDARLDTPYRDGGWSVRQVVHHLADSHLNAYVRVRIALTEEDPTVRPYDENAWAALADAHRAPLEPSLAVLDGVHQRWAYLLRSLDAGAFSRPFTHPEGWSGTVDTLLALYAWHGRHHTAHITSLRARQGW